MSNRNKFVIIITVLIVTFAVGRYTAPEKVKIETRTVEVEKKQKSVDIDRDRNKKTTTKTIIKPDGTKVITSVTEDNTATNIKSKSNSEAIKASETVKEVIKSSSKTHLSALAGINPFKLDNGPDFGASASRTILGPISIGLFGFKSGMCGGSVGVEF